MRWVRVVEASIIILSVMALFALSSTIATYLAITERSLVKAVLYSAIQSTLYALIYYLLMAPDIVLVYVPVSVGLYPAIVLMLIKKTEKEEES